MTPTTTRGPSAHLSWRELACRDGTPYPTAWRSTRAVRLAAAFEQVRAAVGAPIRIGSAYRTPDYNRQIGGARHSQHCDGRALDLYPPAGWILPRFAAVIRAVADDRASPIYGLGIYPTFVHLDIRPAPPHGRLILWQGTRAWAEVKASGGRIA